MPARWVLTDSHYIHITHPRKSFWEHKETDQETGEEIRVQFDVPRLLDPKNPRDWNDRENQRIIVSNEASLEHPRDWVFLGEPTPFMAPLNEAAQLLSDTFEEKWRNPIESLPANGGTSTEEFMKELTSIMKGFATASHIPPTPVGSVSAEAFEALKKQVEALASQNAALLAAKVEAEAHAGEAELPLPKPAPAVERRV